MHLNSNNMKIFNFLIGTVSGYFYLMLGSITIAFSKINISSFLLNNCAREAVGKASDTCKMTNRIGFAVFDILHFGFAAICIVGLLVLLNFAFKHIKYTENLFMFTGGLMLGWSIEYFPEMSLGGIFEFLVRIFVFMSLYYLTLKAISKSSKTNH
jgi:hypothetical protein